MKKIFLPLLILTLTYLFSGCYYDSNEALFGQPGIVACDTTVTNFTAQIKPILQSNCYSCHSNAHAAGSGAGIKLEDYADVKTYATNGRLFGTIVRPAIYSPMPKGGGKLSDCEIKIIKIWITKGAINN